MSPASVSVTTLVSGVGSGVGSGAASGEGEGLSSGATGAGWLPPGPYPEAASVSSAHIISEIAVKRLILSPMTCFSALDNCRAQPSGLRVSGPKMLSQSARA